MMPIPYFIKKFGSYLYRSVPLPLHYGKRYREIASFLNETWSWTPEQLRDYQLDRLCRIVDHAYNNTVFYRELYSDAGFAPGDIKSFDDFKKLPSIDRVSLAEREEDFKANNFQQYNSKQTHTSGTSGNPLRVYRSMDTELFRLASVWRWRQTQGINYYDTMADLAGNVSMTDLNQLFYWNPKENIWHLNRKLRDRQHICAIFDHLHKKKVKLITGSPSTIMLISQLALEENLQLSHPITVMTTGELIRPIHIQKIEQVFGESQRDMYGNRENSMKAFQYQYAGDYFVHSESCYLELLDEDGSPTNENTGEVCSTSLINEAFPLIRYRSTDIASDCGTQEWRGMRRWTIKPLGGRTRDVILTPNGLMSINLIHNLGNFDMSLIRNFMIRQHKLDELEICLCPTPEYQKSQNEALFLTEIRKQIPNVMNIKLSYIDKLPITNNGKVKFVESQLALDYLAR